MEEFNEWQELREARKNYANCYKEAKRYTSYKDKEGDWPYQVRMELSTKGYRYQTFMVGSFIFLTPILTAYIALTKDIISVICGAILGTIGIISLSLVFMYWSNKYFALTEELAKAYDHLKYVEEEYQNRDLEPWHRHPFKRHSL